MVQQSQNKYDTGSRNENRYFFLNMIIPLEVINSAWNDLISVQRLLKSNVFFYSTLRRFDRLRISKDLRKKKKKDFSSIILVALGREVCSEFRLSYVDSSFYSQPKPVWLFCLGCSFLLQLIISVPWHPTLVAIQVPFLFTEKF